MASEQVDRLVAKLTLEKEHRIWAALYEFGSFIGFLKTSLPTKKKKLCPMRQWRQCRLELLKLVDAELLSLQSQMNRLLA